MMTIPLQTETALMTLCIQERCYGMTGLSFHPCGFGIDSKHRLNDTQWYRKIIMFTGQMNRKIIFRVAIAHSMSTSCSKNHGLEQIH